MAAAAYVCLRAARSGRQGSNALMAKGAGYLRAAKELRSAAGEATPRARAAPAAGEAGLTEAMIDALERGEALGGASASGSSSSSSSASASPPLPSASSASSSASAPADAEHLALARAAEARRAKALRRRAVRREAYLAKLAAAGKYNPATGLPKPDPERWVPRVQRARTGKGRGKGAGKRLAAAAEARKGGGLHSGVGHQGSAVSASALSALDAKARSDAAKAAAEEAAAGGAGGGGGAAAASGSGSARGGGKKK